MKEENTKFQIENELGEIKEAEVLSIVEIDGKKYVVYTIDNNDETVDVFASYMEKDEDGYDKLVDIESAEDKAKIEQYIKELSM